MSMFAAIGLLISLVALITCINQLTVKAPLTIAVAFSAMVISLFCLLLGALNLATIDADARQILSEIHFENLLLRWLLSLVQRPIRRLSASLLHDPRDQKTSALD